MIYRKYITINGVEIITGVSEDGKTVSFTKDPNNPDCQKYLEWIAILGNEALPPDPQPE